MRARASVSRLSPKPIIAQVYKTWHLPVGMSFSLVEDLERHVWIVKSCPVGTQVWSVEQAELLPRGAHTRRPLREAVQLGRETCSAETPRCPCLEEAPTRSRTEKFLSASETRPG